jgi:DNA invertase Pin-like site-specific DNA recombinase
MANQHLVGYARVSTKTQSNENQIQRLEQFGCEKVFADKYSGATTDREQLQAALAYIREGDTFVITKLDRLARSSVDLGKTAELFQRKNVDFVVLDQDINTTTPTGKLMFNMIGAFAEFERDLIQERCREGIEKARARGVKFGRRPKLTTAQLVALKLDYNAGELTKADLAKKYQISIPSVYRLVAGSKD